MSEYLDTYLKRLHKEAADILKDPVVKWQFDDAGKAYLPGDTGTTEPFLLDSGVKRDLSYLNPEHYYYLPPQLLTARALWYRQNARRLYSIYDRQREEHRRKLVDRWKTTKGVGIPTAELFNYWNTYNRDVKDRYLYEVGRKNKDILRSKKFWDDFYKADRKRWDEFDEYSKYRQSLGKASAVSPFTPITPYPNISNPVIAKARTPIDSLSTSKL